MKDKKTPVADINKIPNHNLFVEYERQMKERYPEFYPRIEKFRNYVGKLREELKFFIPNDDGYELEFVMHAKLEPKNGKFKCGLDYNTRYTTQASVDFDETTDVRKMNIRNVILSACDLLEQYSGTSEIVKTLLDKEK